MEEFKGTKGEFTYSSGYGHIIMVNGKFFCHCSGDEYNPKLICEVFNAVTRTGLTPEQMDKRISDLEARLKESNSLLSRAYGHVYEDNELANEIELHLTKEKTK